MRSAAEPHSQTGPPRGGAWTARGVVCVMCVTVTVTWDFDVCTIDSVDDVVNSQISPGPSELTHDTVSTRDSI